MKTNLKLSDKPSLMKWGILFFIVIASADVYLNVLSNDFVYDDNIELLKNPWIKDLKFIPQIFLFHSWSFEYAGSASSHYHPMKFVVNMLQFWLFGMKPFGYHLTNMVVNSMVVVMVFFTACVFLKKIANEENVLFPAAAAIIFAVHPAHTEAVAWISAMPELMMSFFYVLSFLIFMTTDARPRIGFILSGILFFIAVLFKETAMTLPLLLIVYDYFFKEGIFSGSLKGKAKRIRILKRYLPFIAVMLIYFLLRVNALGEIIPEKGYRLNAFGLAINILVLFSKYLETLVLPVNLSVIHVFHPVTALYDGRVLAAILESLIFISVVLVVRKKYPLLFFSLLWMVVPLLPILYIPAFTGESVMAERYLYLPSAGFAIALTFFFQRMVQGRFLKWIKSPVAIAVLIALMTLSALETVKRNYVWKDNFTLWLDTVRKSPDSSVAHNNLGNAYYRMGRLEDSAREYKTALSIRPDYMDAQYNLSVVNAIKEAIKRQDTK